MPDVTVLCLGLDCSVEGEEISGATGDYLDRGDRKSLFLPKPQMKLAEAVCDVCKDVIVVLLCGGSIDVGETVRKHAKAIIYGWYPGAVGGLAIAEAVLSRQGKSLRQTAGDDIQRRRHSPRFFGLFNARQNLRLYDVGAALPLRLWAFVYGIFI